VSTKRQKKTILKNEVVATVSIKPQTFSQHERKRSIVTISQSFLKKEKKNHSNND
jgi:hypothetical protein